MSDLPYEELVKLRMFAFEQAAVIVRFNEKEDRYKKVKINPIKSAPASSSYDEIFAVANDIIEYCLKGQL